MTAIGANVRVGERVTNALDSAVTAGSARSTPGIAFRISDRAVAMWPGNQWIVELDIGGLAWTSG